MALGPQVSSVLASRVLGQTAGVCLGSGRTLEVSGYWAMLYKKQGNSQAA
jgi:hypothetical protein